MDKGTLRKYEMGERALEFSRAHPDDTAGYNRLLDELGAKIFRANQLETQQQAGFRSVRSAADMKARLRHEIIDGHIRHISSVSRKAARFDSPGLQQLFRLAGATTHEAFRIAGRRIAADAKANEDVLLKHGLSSSVLDGLSAALDRFDAAMQLMVTSRAAHTGASAELEETGKAIVQIVNALDGINRTRFAPGSDALGAWMSARNVFGPITRSTADTTDTGSSDVSSTTTTHGTSSTESAA